MTFYIEEMRIQDVPEVSRVDRQCFTNPWPQSAYRRELRNSRNNYYVVLRESREDAESELEPETTASRRLNLLPFLKRSDPPLANDPIIGFSGMWVMFDEAHITTIGVLPEYRGRGLGEYLMVHLFEEAMRREADWVTLEVRVSNSAAQALYRKYGFTRQGIRRRYYSDNGEDAYIMWSPRVQETEFIEQFDALRQALLNRLGNQIQPAKMPSIE